MSAKATVVIYSRPGCHLCEEAKAVMRSADCTDLYTLSEVNIETDATLQERYKNDIPVITINGVQAFKHRLTAEAFRRRILRAAL
jgi:glutaredoxin